MQETVSFDELVDAAVDHGRKARAERLRKRRANGKRGATVAALTRRELEAHPGADDVELVRLVLAASGWESSGFDAMTGGELGHLLRVARRVQAVAQAERKKGGRA